MTNISTAYNWYAIITRSRTEKKVWQHLTNLEIECYLPIFRVKRQWSDRTVWCDIPAISSYVFLRTTSIHLRSIIQHQSIVRIVSWQGEAAIIPDLQIEIMRNATEHKLHFTLETNTLKKGRYGTITSGPLKGVSGIINEIRDNNKLIIKIDQMGCDLVIDLDNTSFELKQVERGIFNKVDNKLAQKLIGA